MKVIGIVGGIASGKSFVAKCLESLGAKHLNADVAGHQVLRKPAVKQQLRERWGDRVFDDSGEIVRKKLAEIVFGEGISAQRERTFLEQLTHPQIRETLITELKAAEAAGSPAVVVDAALLLESNWSELCDSILFIDTPAEIRLSRATDRGWSESEWKAREASQLSLDRKRDFSDATIDNSGSMAETSRQVRDYWDSLFATDVSH